MYSGTEKKIEIEVDYSPLNVTA